MKKNILAENMRRFNTKNLNEEDFDSNNNGYPDDTEKIAGKTNFTDFEEWINSYSEYQDSDTATLVEEFNTSFGNTRVKETGKVAWRQLKKEIIDDFNRTGTADSVFEKYGFALNDESTSYTIGGIAGSKVSLRSNIGQFIDIGSGMGRKPTWRYENNSGTGEQNQAQKDKFGSQVYPNGSRKD